MTGFEGSFLGSAGKISPQAIMECKICWSSYDPAHGDAYRQIEAGTAFLDLPGDWSCPDCGAPKEQFMVLEDPGSEAAGEARRIAARCAALEADFTEIWHAKMRDVPMVNKLLHVQATGFRAHEGRLLGVLVAPWFMNLVLLPAEGEDWSDLVAGHKETIAFPSGAYEFIHNTREMTGGYKACSLFSPMGEFRSQAQAVEVAQAVMVALFDAGNMAETDRAADIRQAREARLADAAEQEDGAGKAGAPVAPTRRALITGGLAAEEIAGA